MRASAVPRDTIYTALCFRLSHWFASVTLVNLHWAPYQAGSVSLTNLLVTQLCGNGQGGIRTRE